mmetsp:Transcript_287/g.553  ORF Transcript_287/g.553 Transcript_287/m.553 type:complete len:204 (+) Transcript_287:306-917(+)
MVMLSDGMSRNSTSCFLTKWSNSLSTPLLIRPWMPPLEAKKVKNPRKTRNTRSTGRIVRPREAPGCLGPVEPAESRSSTSIRTVTSPAMATTNSIQFNATRKNASRSFTMRRATSRRRNISTPPPARKSSKESASSAESRKLAIVRPKSQQIASVTTISHQPESTTTAARDRQSSFAGVSAIQCARLLRRVSASIRTASTTEK